MATKTAWDELEMFHGSDMIIRWIERYGFTRIAEIGVFKGKVTAAILEACPELVVYLAVDIDLSRMPEALKSLYARQIHLMEMPSVEAAQLIDDNSLDLVFLDSDHRYEAVAADIVAWWPKIRDGGIFCGHDYIPLPTAESWVTVEGYAKIFSGRSAPAEDDDREAGVKRAVDEAFPAANLTAELYPARWRYIWWVEKGWIKGDIDHFIREGIVKV